MPSRSRNPIGRAALLGAAFGVLVAALEIHAYAASTFRFDVVSSLAFVAYLAGGFAAGGVVLRVLAQHSRSAVRTAQWHPTALVAGGLLGLLACTRAIVDGELIALARSHTLRLGAFTLLGLTIVSLALGVPLLHARRIPDRGVRLRAICLSAAAIVYAAFLTRLALSTRGWVPFAAILLASMGTGLLGYAAALWMRRGLALAVLAAVALLPLAWRWMAGPPRLASVRTEAPAAVPAPPGAENVVLIVLDTLRADHLALYGYERDTMPRLGRFARGATLFEHCSANSSWSLPAHATLFTGLYPREHRATHGSAVLDEERPPRRLSDEATTIAEILYERGYRTYGISGNYAYVSERWGLHQGFDYWDARSGYKGASAEGFWPVLFRALLVVDKFWFRWLFEPLVWLDIGQVHYRRADEISNESIRLVDLHSASDPRPFFLFVNYMDPHDPFRAPPAFVDHFPGRLRDRPRDYSRGTGFGDLSPEALRSHFSSLYDSELAFLDNELDRLLRSLEARGLLEQSIVIITSDHGEQFLERGSIGHGRSLHEEELRVPLLIHDPKRSPGLIRHPVEHRDLVPWILERLSNREPHVSSSDLFLGSTANFSELFASPRGDETAVRDGTLKYLHASDGEETLFDLAQDPGEQRDLRPLRPELSLELAKKLERWSERVPLRRAGQARDLDPSELQMLRDLGYVQ